MLIPVILCVFTAKVTMGQLNGEFWWLNDKVAKLKGIEPSSVEIEEDSEFDNDETDKIVFRDRDLINEVNTETRKDNEMKLNMKFEDQSELIYPTIDNNHIDKISKDYIKIEDSDKKDQDVFNFVFPNSALKFNERNASQMRNTKELESKTTKQGNICVYMTKTQCHRQSGYVYFPDRHSVHNNQLICCVAALPFRESINDIRLLEHTEPETKKSSDSSIYFPNDDINRHKRSTNQNISPVLEQRKFLLMRKYGSRIFKANTTLVPKRTNQKIVTSEEDYTDPYWNIKNSNFKKPNKDKISSQSTDKYDYDYRDYADEYIDELPKPGLVGLYSDHGSMNSNWKFINNKKPYGSNDDYDTDEDTFGYGAIDPRLTKNRLRRGPMRLTTSITSPEIDYIAENQAIHYNSNPDFKVLQGFKLLNLVRNKSRVSSKHGRKSTTDSAILNNSEESFASSPLHVRSSEDYSEKQIYKECGRAVRIDEYENDRQIGEALNGSHPWLALVVLSRRKRSVLCYATILHPRIAVTASDCVQGRTTPGEISLMAGLWNLENTDRVQQRMPSVYHQQSSFATRDSEDNLASLHWKRPLRLGVSVQPACLGEPRVGDDCFFIGWGGYDQEIQARSRWQRASILTSRQCKSRLLTQGGHITLPDEAFCATIDSKVTVTGVGGPLVCRGVGDEAAVVGAAVWRDTVVVLVPVRGWAMRAAAALDLID